MMFPLPFTSVENLDWSPKKRVNGSLYIHINQNSDDLHYDQWLKEGESNHVRKLMDKTLGDHREG